MTAADAHFCANCGVAIPGHASPLSELDAIIAIQAPGQEAVAHEPQATHLEWAADEWSLWATPEAAAPTAQETSIDAPQSSVDVTVPLFSPDTADVPTSPSPPAPDGPPSRNSSRNMRTVEILAGVGVLLGVGLFIFSLVGNNEGSRVADRAAATIETTTTPPTAEITAAPTAPPTAPPTAAPTPQPAIQQAVPPVEEPTPAPAQPQCHPSYQGACLDPNAEDYDCQGGTGDGPYYTGPVQVVGPDDYELDSDGDGQGCETS